MNQAEGKFCPLHACMSVSLLAPDHQQPQGDGQVPAIVISTRPPGWGPHLSLIFCGQRKHRRPGGVCATSARRLCVVQSLRLRPPRRRNAKFHVTTGRGLFMSCFSFFFTINTGTGHTVTLQFHSITVKGCMFNYYCVSKLWSSAHLLFSFDFISLLCQ